MDTETTLLPHTSDGERHPTAWRVTSQMVGRAALATLGIAACGAFLAHLAGWRKPEELFQSAEQKTLVTVKRDRPLAEKNDEWQCQRYVDDQDDEWCKSVGTKDGFEFKYVGYDGPFAGLCAECWCCKRQVEEPPVDTAETHMDEHRRDSVKHKREVANSTEHTCAAAGEECSGSRCCQKGFQCSQDALKSTWFCKAESEASNEQQPDNASEGNLSRGNASEAASEQKTVEANRSNASNASNTINSTMPNKREVHENQSTTAGPQLKKAQKNESQAMHEEEKEEAPWECLRYLDGQDDGWCKSTTNHSGYRIRWAGPDTDLCGNCWCCKQALVPPKKCSKNGKNCRETECCEQEGFQCFEQDSTWATCKSTCTEKGWSCKEIGERTPMDMPEEGAAPGQICAIGGKCQQEGYQCYQMNDYYSACKVSCEAEDWTCAEYGNRTPVTSMVGGTKCAWGADLCSPVGCCVGEGLQCYARDEYWSSCMGSCNKTMDFGNGPEKWSCKEYGHRRKVELGCTWMNEECTATKLCCHPGFNCVQKDSERAYCTKELNQPGWDGSIIGGSRNEWPVQPVPAGSANESGTTLYCFMAVLPNSPEEDLRWAAESKNASIFACDAHQVYESWQSARGDTGEQHVGKSWGSVINTDVFVNVWEHVLSDRQYLKYDWVVKVDPDAVFFAGRLKYKLEHLHAPKGWPIYIKNTDKDFGFLGACEVLSTPAVEKFSYYIRECFATISAKSGEDGYMKGCMDMIGAGYMLEMDVLRTPWHDGQCTDPGRVTFHPRKDAGSWNACYGEAMR